MESKPKKILVIGPSWVGDMVMAQTLFILLKEQGASIDVLAPAWSQPLLARMPEVNTSFHMSVGHGELKLGLRAKTAKMLAQNKYDQAIVLPNSFKSALIPFLARIPQRTGWRGEMRYILLNDVRVLDKTKYPLMIERFMALGLPANAALPSQYPAPRLKIQKETVDASLNKFNLNTNAPILALCPGAEFGPAKRWPEASYAEIANQMLEQGWQVWLFGSKNDKPVTDKINQLTQGRCNDLAGETSLEEAIDLMSQATKVVSNDSGLMHIAAALNKPLVAIYGSSDPRFTPPLAPEVRMVKENLPCSPCFERICPLGHMQCLTTLKPEKVYRALNELSIIEKG